MATRLLSMVLGTIAPFPGWAQAAGGVDVVKDFHRTKEKKGASHHYCNPLCHSRLQFEVWFGPAVW
jgi:hypothetical protein